MKNGISLFDLSIFERGDKEGYTLAVTSLGGGAVSFGPVYKTRKEARQAMRAHKENFVTMDITESFNFCHALVFRLRHKRLKNKLEFGGPLD